MPGFDRNQDATRAAGLRTQSAELSAQTVEARLRAEQASLAAQVRAAKSRLQRLEGEALRPGNGASSGDGGDRGADADSDADADDALWLGAKAHSLQGLLRGAAEGRGLLRRLRFETPAARSSAAAQPAAVIVERAVLVREGAGMLRGSRARTAAATSMARRCADSLEIGARCRSCSPR